MASMNALAKPLCRYALHAKLGSLAWVVADQWGAGCTPENGLPSLQHPVPAVSQMKGAGQDDAKIVANSPVGGVVKKQKFPDGHANVGNRQSPGNEPSVKPH